MRSEGREEKAKRRSAGILEEKKTTTERGI
jgi:hypothetical protein